MMMTISYEQNIHNDQIRVLTEHGTQSEVITLDRFETMRPKCMRPRPVLI